MHLSDFLPLPLVDKVLGRSSEGGVSLKFGLSQGVGAGLRAVKDLDISSS